MSGAEWAPVAPTPSDTIWRRGKAELRRYRRDSAARYDPPVLVFLGLVSRAYVFDLWKGNSFVQRLMDGGFETFVLDWGEPDAVDAGNTLETYVEDYLPRAIDATMRATGSSEVTIVGYCMGGDLALAGLAAGPDLPVRNLVTMATPIDFHQMGPLADTLRDGRLEVDDVVDETGNVPGNVIENFFKIRKPTADVAQYANLWQNLWNDDYMESFQAMGRWMREHVPFPGAAARQVVDQWLRANAFCNDTLRIGGRAVSLGDIGVPTLAVIATRDDVVFEAAAAPIVDCLTGTQVDTLRLEAGHASLTVGRTAAKVAVPQIVEWIASHSEELP